MSTPLIRGHRRPDEPGSIRRQDRPEQGILFGAFGRSEPRLLRIAVGRENVEIYSNAHGG